MKIALSNCSCSSNCSSNCSCTLSLVDFRSAVGLPYIYDHQSVANTGTRYAPNRLVARVFPPMAPSQDGERADPLLMCCSAPNTEGDLGSCRALSSRSVSLFECSQRVLQRCFTLPQESKKQRSKMYEIRCHIH